MSLKIERKELYDQVQRAIGHTPLKKLEYIKIPHNNVIFFKEEYRNPTGSHYDREFIRLLRSLEDRELIIPFKTPLVETTTGNAGASFAWLCRVLGYTCKVIIPEDVPSARIAQIKSFGAEVILSPSKQYVKGVIETLRSELRDKNKNKEEYCPNHAADEKYCIEAMKDLGREIVDDISKLNQNRIDYYVSALGNGSSLRGVGEILKNAFSTKIIGVEPLASPSIFIKKFGNEIFYKEYGCDPKFGPHGLLGTGAWGTDFQFPNTRFMQDEIDEIILVTEQQWEEQSKNLADKEYQHVGRTSAACFYAALKAAERVERKAFVLIFYDASWKYLDISNNQNGNRHV